MLPAAALLTPAHVGQWFDAHYTGLLGHRAHTMRAALVRLKQTGGRLIVESGCCRQEGNWAGDGQSTLVFAAYGRKFAAAVMSADVDPAAVRLAQRLVKEHCGTDVHVTVRCGDAEREIAAVNQPIDLLYLDSLDFRPQNPGPSQERAWREFEAAEPWLHEESVVLIDDCDLPHGGKGGMLIPEMERRGWRVLMREYQVLLSRSAL